jgi:Flp pilus assembly protein TadG
MRAARSGNPGGRVRRFFRRTDGITAVEFALVAPILILLLLGTFELSRFVWLEVKIDRTAVSLGDLLSRQDSLGEASISSLFEASELLMKPFPTGGLSKVIFTSLSPTSATDFTPVINWQRSGGGTLGETSRIAPCGTGQPAKLPAGTLGKNVPVVIVTEVFYSFTPITGQGVMKPHIIYRNSFFSPRIASLVTISGSPGWDGTEGTKCN